MSLIRLLWAVALLSLAAPLSGATFTVTDTSDAGPGTFRQAILDANANPGLDQIRFTVPGVNVFAPLPDITDPVDIDGAFAPGSRFTISNAAAEGRLVFQTGSSGSVARNLAFDPAVLPVIRIHAGVTGVTIAGNDLRGRVAIDGNNNLFGGTTAADRNFGLYSLEISGSGNEVVGNMVLAVGVTIGANNRIGRAGNGNQTGNLSLHNAPGTIVEGNDIRAITGIPNISVTQSAPTAPSMILGNTIRDGTVGVYVEVPGTIIRGNTIRNHTWGVLVPTGATGVEITGNSIFGNDIAIDLNSNGPSANDPAPDADTGANNLQNYPVLTSATLNGGSLVVTGTLTSTPLLTYLVELFANDAADPEARTLLASFEVTADATGTAAFTRTITSPLPTADEVVTSTATNRLTADTSEVSAAVAIEAPGTLAFDSATYTVNETDATITITVNRTGGSEGTVTVQYATQNGTAAAPGDFTATSGTLTFGPGVTSQSFAVPIVSDAIPEGEETFTVALSNATGGATIGTATATVVIASHLPEETIPTASTWALIILAASLAFIALRRG